MAAINGLGKVADYVRDHRLSVQYADKAFKVGGYALFLIARYSGSNRLAGISSKIFSVRPIFYAALALPDTRKLGKRIYNQDLEDKILALLDVNMVFLELSLVSGSALSFFSRTQKLSQQIGFAAGVSVLSLSALAIAQTWNETRTRAHQTADWCEYGDNGFELVCTSLELADQSGYVSGFAGLGSGLMNVAGNVFRSLSKPVDS